MADLRSEMTRIHREGRLTPANVVEAAVPEDSPLHPHFEWDDTIAGPKYRLVQARELIRSQRIVYKPATNNSAPASYRAFVNTATPEGEPIYRPTEEVLEDPLARQILLRQARREIEQLRARYGHLSEWAALLDEAKGAAG